MRTLIAAVLLPLALAACQSVPDLPDLPELPGTTTVVVERYRDLPAWATEPLHVAPRADGRVESHLRHEAALQAAVDLANCHRRLLARLDAEQPVAPSECMQ